MGVRKEVEEEAEIKGGLLAVPLPEGRAPVQELLVGSGMVQLVQRRQQSSHRHVVLPMC